MKKPIISLIVIICILLEVTGCANSSTINPNTMPENDTDFDNIHLIEETRKSISTNNKTVGTGISYDVEGKSVIKHPVDGLDMAIDSSLDSLAKYSTEVIRGTTRSVSFMGINGQAWTKVDVQITDSLKGALQQGDIISIYLLGGYISLTEYMNYYKNESRFAKLSDVEIENTLLQFVVEKEALPIVDEDLVYFLEMTPVYSPLPSGAYERICGKDAQFKVSSNGKTLTRDPLNSYDKTYELQYVKSFLLH